MRSCEWQSVQHSNMLYQWLAWQQRVTALPVKGANLRWLELSVSLQVQVISKRSLQHCGLMLGARSPQRA